MVMSKEWNEKVANALKKKMKATDYAIMSEDRSRRSWSAAHPAYMGTSLCPDPRYRGGDTNGLGDSEAVHRCLRAGEGSESGYTEA